MSIHNEIVADPPLVLEELCRHHGADGVAAEILRPRRAAAVAVEPRHGVRPAGLERAAEDVALAQLNVSISRWSPAVPFGSVEGASVTS